MLARVEDYEVEIVREPAGGVVETIIVKSRGGDAWAAIYEGAELDLLLAEAREADGDRDPRSEGMPSDEAIIRVALAEMGVEVEEGR